MKNVKKFAFLVLVFVSTMAFSQAYNGKGDKKLSAGLSAFGYGTGITGTFDYGLTDLISIGAGSEFYFEKENNSNDNLFVFGRLNFHLGKTLNLSEQMDLYPGVNLGVRADEFGLGAHLGFRYFFSDNLGAFIEIGNHGSIGISYSF